MKFHQKVGLGACIGVSIVSPIGVGIAELFGRSTAAYSAIGAASLIFFMLCVPPLMYAFYKEGKDAEREIAAQAA